MEKEYLGDSVYVERDEHGIILTTENGIDVSNRIVLEPETLRNFAEFIERLQKP